MERVLEGERNFFSEEADFMAQLLANFSSKLPNVSTYEASSPFWPHPKPTMKLNKPSPSISDSANTNMSCLLHDDSYTDGSSVLFPTSSGESYLSITRSEKSIFFSKDTQMGEEGTEVSAAEAAAEYNHLSRKRSCSLPDVCMSWKRTKCSKSQKPVNMDEADHAAVYRHITTMHDSDDDLNGLQDPSPRPKGVQVLNSNGKKRASMGSATDSQSVYARKRRERINERLRILQKLVPNGTKVDISTMLEEAVEYVKFLQLQIKLLSSDELWMYAPIAYNGMNIGGIDMKLPSPR